MGLREKFIILLLKISALVVISVGGMLLTYTAIEVLVTTFMRCGESEVSCFGRGFILGAIRPLFSLGVGIAAAIWFYRRFMSGSAKRKQKLDDL